MTRLHELLLTPIPILIILLAVGTSLSACPVYSPDPSPTADIVVVSGTICVNSNITFRADNLEDLDSEDGIPKFEDIIDTDSYVWTIRDGAEPDAEILDTFEDVTEVQNYTFDSPGPKRIEFYLDDTGEGEQCLDDDPQHDPVYIIIVVSSNCNELGHVYVDELSPGPDHDGRSWDTAFTTINSAFLPNALNYEIWVAGSPTTGEQKYEEDVDMVATISLYGGFAGHVSDDSAPENTKAGRVAVNVTTIHGSQSRSVVIVPSDATTATVIDGFTIQHGSAVSGGGIFCDEDASPTISNNVITGNTATFAGGGVSCEDGSPVISGNTITHNSQTASAFGGGGIYAENSSAQIIDNVLSNNTAYSGGAIYLNVGTGVEIAGNSICDNATTSKAGGIFAYDVDGISITDNTIRGNSCASLGGGMYLSSGTGVEISGNSVSANTADSYGGLFCNGSGSLAIYNNTVTGNKATGEGGGIYVSGGNPALVVNNTVVSNRAGSGYCGGIYMNSFYSDSAITNNIVTSNSSGIYRSNLYYHPLRTYNDVLSNPGYDYSPALSGSENGISENPLFIDAGSWNQGESEWTEGDYRLATTPNVSPCIDAGTSDNAPTIDKVGRDRPYPTDGDWDMGAYEHGETTPPDAVDAVSPDYDNGSPIVVAYEGASDPGSGLHHVELWWKKETTGQWGDSELRQTGANGSFNFTPSSGEGTYYFDLVVVDNELNRSPEAAGDGDDSTIYDITPPTIESVSAPHFASSSPITVSYTNATDSLSSLEKVELWYKVGCAGEWTYYSSNTQASGDFTNFAITEGNVYYFDFVAEDNAGNRTAEAVGDGACETVYEPGLTATNRTVIRNQYLYPGGPQIGATVYGEDGARFRGLVRTLGPEGELMSVWATKQQQPHTYDPVVSYSYDACYRVTGITDGNSNPTSFIYDDDDNPETEDPRLGLLTKVVYPEGDFVRFSQHDPMGRVLKRIDTNGTTSYSYLSPEGFLTDIRYPSEFSDIDVHLTYNDDYGRLTEVLDGTGTRSYEYDDLDLVTQVTTSYSGLSGGERAIDYSYYPNGLLDTISSDTFPTPNQSFAYTYDGVGKLTGLTNPKDEDFSWSYYDNNRLHTQTTPVTVTTYDYNSRGFLTSMVNEKIDSPNNILLSSFTADASADYDAVGNLLSLTTDVPSAIDNKVTSYTYDNKNQLTLEDSERNGGYTRSFVYDAAGNNTTLRGTSGRTFNENNQNEDFTYDDNGNPTTYNSASLSYDPEDRLTAYGSALTAGYTSDGLRAWKQVGTTGTYFLGPCELDGSSGQLVAIDTYGPNGLLSRYTTSGGSVFYTFDPQGSVVQTVTGAGSVGEAQLYDAYGSLVSGSATPPYGFGAQHGYYTDSETGLQLLTFRYYDPAEGRFLTRDPIGYVGGANLYNYVEGNPVAFVDPFGLLTQYQYDKLVEIRGYAEAYGTAAAAAEFSNTGGPSQMGPQFRNAPIPTAQYGEIDFDWYLTLIQYAGGIPGGPLEDAEYIIGKNYWNYKRLGDPENTENPGRWVWPYEDPKERRTLRALRDRATIQDLFPPGFLEKHRPPKIKNKREKP